jgi:NAD(P)-dependent dehydrogenase (short-subunit alcohol dehydrogenase family)
VWGDKARDDLSGQTALVTGGTRGIGAAIARALAVRGCRLLLSYREQDEPAKAMRHELVARGASVALVRADLTDAARLREMFETIKRTAGRQDILVHNAGPMLRDFVRPSRAARPFAPDCPPRTPTRCAASIASAWSWRRTASPTSVPGAAAPARTDAPVGFRDA